MSRPKNLGLDGKFYYNRTADLGGLGTYAAPEWVLMDAAADVNITRESDEADQMTRGNGDWDDTIATIRRLSVSASMKYKPQVAAEKANYEEMEEAWFDGTIIDCLILKDDMAVDGTKGLRVPMQVRSMSDAQPLKDVMSSDLEFKFTSSADQTKPERVTMPL